MFSFLKKFFPQTPPSSVSLKQSIAVPVSSCMTPRMDLEEIAHDKTAAEIKEIFRKKKTDFLVISDAHSIRGVLLLKDFFLQEKEHWQADLLKPVFFSSAVDLETILLFFCENPSCPMVFLLDSYGEIHGGVSLLLIIKKILNKKNKRNDQMILSSDPLKVSARISLKDLAESISFPLEKEAPGQDYQTLAGFLLAFIKRFPKQGEVIAVHGFNFKIAACTQKTIDEVLIYPLCTKQEVPASSGTV